MTHTFSNDHDNPKDSQLIVAITGSSEYIVEQLKQLLEECNSAYGKPSQGHYSAFGGQMQVTTAMWDKKAY